MKPVIRAIVFFVVLLVAFPFSPSFSGAAEPIRWTAVSGYPPGNNEFDICLPTLIKAIEKETKGQIKIKLVPPGVLVPEKETLNGLAAGMFEMALSSTWAKVPETNIGHFVFYAARKWEDVAVIFYDNGVLDWIRKAGQKSGALMLSVNVQGPYALFTNFPITSLKDLKGKKIRTSPAAIHQALIQELGGAPATLSGSEVYMGMKLGIVDGMIYSLAELETQKLKEVVKNVVIEPLLAPATLNYNYVNEKAWNSLSPELRKAVDKAGRDAMADMRNQCYARDAIAIKASKEYGVKFINLSKSEATLFNSKKPLAMESVLKTFPECVEGYALVKKWLQKE
jgi:TRAP-type C4-dicarboxylate transport system substrate-binding protein